MSATFTSFAQLANHLRAEDVRRVRAEDVRRAKNLRRSAPLRVNRPTGRGPAVAR